MVWVVLFNREVAETEIRTMCAGTVFRPGLVLWGQDSHMQLVWQKCLRRAAMNAGQALEENEMSADVAVKDLHEQIVIESPTRLNR